MNYSVSNTAEYGDTRRPPRDRGQGRHEKPADSRRAVARIGLETVVPALFKAMRAAFGGHPIEEFANVSRHDALIPDKLVDRTGTNQRFRGDRFFAALTSRKQGN